MKIAHPLAALLLSALLLSPAAPAAARSAQDEPAVYIVQLREPPQPTAGRRVSGAGARPDSARVQQSQRALLGGIARITGAAAVPIQRFDAAFNGMTLRLTAAQAANVARLPEVARVEPDREAQLLASTDPLTVGAMQPDTRPSLFQASADALQGTFVYDAASHQLDYTVTASGAAQLQQGGSSVAALSYAGGAVYAGALNLSASAEAALFGGTLELVSGAARAALTASRGEGVVVGVIDTGVNARHRSFAATGADGFHHSNPRGAGRYVGVCDPANPIYQPSFPCNDKLIGAWTWPATNASSDPLGKPSPWDDDTHGSHTSSTAAGNVVDATVGGTALGRIAGIAPHANIIVYDACNRSGCPYSALLASINQAVLDGVDVLNYSIGSSSNDPWTSLEALALLGAFNAGVVTAVAAGNSGPGAATLGAPANAPWVVAAAATSHGRTFQNSLTDLSGGARPLAALSGRGLSAAMNAPAPLVYAGNAPYNNPLCDPFPSGTRLNGAVVVCDRGTTGRVEKAQNALNAGAGGFVLANDAANGAALTDDSYPLPGVQISYADGVALRQWLSGGSGHSARVGGTASAFDGQRGDILASFSSRGPDSSAPGVLKPDVAAPGVDVLAAASDSSASSDEFAFLSGTSMATPHVAGALALLHQLHPDWRPAALQSALELTAADSVRHEDGSSANPHERGGGRVSLGRAARAGLVLEASAADYVLASPLLGGDARTLNRASLANPACVVTCSWTRTFSNTLNVAVSWRVQAAASSAGLVLSARPEQFTIAPGAVQTVTFSADVRSVAAERYGYGQFTLSAGGGVAPDAALPVAARSASSDIPSAVRIVTASGRGIQALSNLRTAYGGGLAVRTQGLVPAQMTDAQISPDTRHDTPLDNLDDGVLLRPVEVPAGTARLVTEIITTTAADLDLYVYRDGAGGPLDGQPQVAEQVCAAASQAALERCDLSGPTGGRYLVLVHSYVGSSGGDRVQLAIGVVPQASSSSLVVSAPQNVAAGEPFSLLLNWALDGARAGQRWYGTLSIVPTGPSTQSNLGSINVDLALVAPGAAELPKLPHRVLLPALSR